MGNSQNRKHSMTVDDLVSLRDQMLVLDVRKPAARALSGHTIPDADYRHPFDALNWKKAYGDRKVVVFCVHGHEVSQSVSGYLREEGIEAVYLEGGFEAWKAASHPCELIEELAE